MFFSMEGKSMKKLLIMTTIAVSLSGSFSGDIKAAEDPVAFMTNGFSEDKQKQLVFDMMRPTMNKASLKEITCWEKGETAFTVLSWVLSAAPMLVGIIPIFWPGDKTAQSVGTGATVFCAALGTLFGVGEKYFSSKIKIMKTAAILTHPDFYKFMQLLDFKISDPSAQKVQKELAQKIETVEIKPIQSNVDEQPVPIKNIQPMQSIKEEGNLIDPNGAPRIQEDPTHQLVRNNKVLSTGEMQLVGLTRSTVSPQQLAKQIKK